jgi:hypothetical protein
VTLAPLPDSKIKVVKTANGDNTGILKVVNFTGTEDIKKEIRRLKNLGNDDLDGSIDDS